MSAPVVNVKRTGRLTVKGQCGHTYTAATLPQDHDVVVSLLQDARCPACGSFASAYKAPKAAKAAKP